ncbi:chloride channel protein [Companilactobacillus sp. DQM5]|uniref:chloride channel protein n=1 Tax=Companilactobacillus sp. DQM5 TaxID=3463359 RepID=UPI00405A229E
MKKNKLLNNTNILFILKGALIGTMTGIVVSLFRLAIQKMLFIIISFFSLAHSNHIYLFILIFIFLIIGVIASLLIKSDQNIKGSGIPEIEGQLMGELNVSWFSVLWKKFIAGILSIGSGLFLGREGPSIQLGGVIGQGTSEIINSNPSEKRILIASGAAAGLSAAFNAPIAGTLFILEEVYHNFSPLVWISALSSSLFSDFISSNFFGLTPVLNIHYTKSFPLNYYWILIILGIILGLLGFIYQKSTLIMPNIYEKLFANIPNYFYGFIPLLILVPIGYYAPKFLGGGNSLILDLSQQHITLFLIIFIFLLRFSFSIISYGSGLPGGIFLPILTLGALIGGILGLILNQFHLLPTEYISNLLIFSMAGYFSGIGKAPFSAIILITEMVGNLSHLLPLAVVSLVAYITVDVLGGAPIYESLLQKKISINKVNQLSSDIDQLEFPIYENSSFTQQRVRNIKWPQKTLLSYIRHGDNNIIPNGDTVIRPGDTLIVLIDSKKRAEVKKELDILSKRE